MEPARPTDPLPLIELRDGFVYVGCAHNLDPSVRTVAVEGEDVTLTALRGVWTALCRQVLHHTGRDERPLGEDGQEHWYVYRNLSGRLCSVAGCETVHPYLMVEHTPYADTQTDSPLDDCPAVPAEPGMEVVVREVQEGVQTQGWRQNFVYRAMRVP